MELKQLNAPIRCDMPMCKQKADYGINAHGGLRCRQINICKDCMTKLFELIGGVIIPKSPNNLIIKAVKRRENDAK